MTGTRPTESGRTAATPVVEAGAFKAVMAEMPAAVTVITCFDGTGHPLGATLSAVTSLSLDPPLLLACFDTGSETLAALCPGAPFLVHLLAAGQEEAAGIFAGKGRDKFERAAWSPGLEGLPELPGSAAVLACTVDRRMPGGDHVIVTGLVGATRQPGGMPLVYHRRRLFPAQQQEEAPR